MRGKWSRKRKSGDESPIDHSIPEVTLRSSTPAVSGSSLDIPRPRYVAPASTARTSLFADNGENPIIESEAEEVRDFNGRLHFKIAHQVPPLGTLAETSMELSDKLLLGMERNIDGIPLDSGTLGRHKLLGMANNGYFGQSLQKRKFLLSRCAEFADLRPERGQSPKVPAIISKGIISIEQVREETGRF